MENDRMVGIVAKLPNTINSTTANLDVNDMAVAFASTLRRSAVNTTPLRLVVQASEEP